jgi:threonine aldolase
VDFRSDNVSGVLPEVMAALAEANRGTMTSYGDDPISARVEERLSEIFEKRVRVFPVSTGSAANALALSVLTPPWGVVYCHSNSHIEVDECGGPEFFTGGAKLHALEGAHGKIAAKDLEEELKAAPFGNVHNAQPAAISITQSSEWGTAYRPADVAAIGALARRHKLRFHMDGARFANALAYLGGKPADMTWRAGVDVLSFGATKGGAMGAEAVILFDEGLAQEFAFRRKRAGQLFSKMRFVAAQLEGYLKDDAWLKAARHANGEAAALGRGLAQVPGVELAAPVEGNQVFAVLPPTLREALEAEGFRFYTWDAGAPYVVRFVTSFATERAGVDRLIAAARRHQNAA